LVDLIQRQTGKLRWHPSQCLSEPETGMACLTTSLAAIGREYSTLVKKRAENKDGQSSTGLGSDPHAEPAEHRPGAVVIETIVLEDNIA
jgi:hypothetical protein